eukprot:TRINITY_DN5661_c0_g2_i1.p1 TRINITY_DN5661_c0_g2~~TRINITY_DN5661_c0_g2_i1.p1  ORF type:complete len:176 (+),score=60.58 TRINITY_DN5661_c0_g2_i1:226-753(+)
MESLSEENILEIRAHFDAADKMASGYLNAEAVKLCIKELAKSRSSKYKEAEDAEIQNMIAFFCSAGGARREINFAEFLHMMGKRSKDTDQNDSLKQLFNRFDFNGDGVVIIGELRAAMASLGRQLGVANWTDAQIDTMIREGDSNKDGVLDFEEFKRIMLSPKQTSLLGIGGIGH